MTKSKKTKLLNDVTAPITDVVASILNLGDDLATAMTSAFDATYEFNKKSQTRSEAMSGCVTALIADGIDRPSLLTSPDATKHKSELTHNDWDKLNEFTRKQMHEADQELLAYSKKEAQEAFGKIKMRHWLDANKLRLDMIKEFRTMLITRLAPKKKGAKNRKKTASEYITDMVEKAQKRMKTAKNATFDLLELDDMLNDLKVFANTATVDEYDKD